MGFPGLLLPSSDAVGACGILSPTLITFSFSSNPAAYFIFFIFLLCDVKSSQVLNVPLSYLSSPVWALQILLWSPGFLVPSFIFLGGRGGREGFGCLFWVVCFEVSFVCLGLVCLFWVWLFWFSFNHLSPSIFASWDSRTVEQDAPHQLNHSKGPHACL